VTIAAGLRCSNGIVLCADAQETKNALSKVNVPKVRVEPWLRVGKDSPDELMIAVAGAGDGPFIDKIIERAWEDVSIASSFDEACAEMEKSIKTIHKEYGQIFQPGYMPQVEMVYGIKMQGNSKLFTAHGPIVNEKSTYHSVGAGYYMSDFLASRMHSNHLSVSQTITLAAYILFQCKEHVDGCGGESQIAVLNEKGSSKLVPSLEVNTVTQALKDVDEVLSYLLLLPAADPQIPQDEFSDVLETAVNALIAYKKDAKKGLEKYENAKRELVNLGSLLGALTTKTEKE
jgi:hypothetical protein